MRRFSFYSFSIAACALLKFAMLPVDAAVIDLSKPVDQSLGVTGAYWKFDEGAVGESTTAATDHSGNNYDGKLTASATGGLPVYAAGKFGNGVRIGRTSGGTPNALDPSVYWDGSAQGGDASGLDFSESGAFTAGLWLKLDDYDQGANQQIYLIERGLSVFNNADNTQKNRNFFSFQLKKWSGDTWSFTLMLGDGLNPTATVNSGIQFTTPNDLEWHHFAFSLATTDGESVISFYIDGELLSSHSIEYQLQALIAANGSERHLRVGERTSSSHFSAFNGIVDDVFVTEGAHTFAIPEPSAALLVPLVGIGALAARYTLRRRKQA